MQTDGDGLSVNKFVSVKAERLFQSFPWLGPRLNAHVRNMYLAP